MRNPKTADELNQRIAAGHLPITTITLDMDEDASVARAFGEVFAEAWAD